MEKKYILRSQLQVDASPQIKKQLKQIAARNEQTLKETVLLALKEKYPELGPYVKDELRP
ncbi:MAG TPA: hypothetical protein VLE72_02105 [Candidatus Saccharimonadales bacterium]|nr:hypothetical protein [Candidatus Saccharimonadales bacterium]